jgi:hypothetical protein
MLAPRSLPSRSKSWCRNGIQVPDCGRQAPRYEDRDSGCRRCSVTYRGVRQKQQTTTTASPSLLRVFGRGPSGLVQQYAGRVRRRPYCCRHTRRDVRSPFLGGEYRSCWRMLHIPLKTDAVVPGQCVWLLQCRRADLQDHCCYDESDAARQLSARLPFR